MTRSEVAAFTKRVATRIASGDVSARPVSEEHVRRFQEILRQESPAKKKRARRHARG